MTIWMNPRGAMSWTGLIVIATTVFGCPKPPPPDPPPPPPLDDAGVDVEEPPPAPEAGPATCETACAHMRKLGCKLGEDTQEGRKCEQVCEKAQTGTLDLLRWDLLCLTTATACGMCK